MNRKGPCGPMPDNEREHFSGRLTSSEALTIGDIPTPGSSWMDVFEFALTYDAYKEKESSTPLPIWQLYRPLGGSSILQPDRDSFCAFCLC